MPSSPTRPRRLSSKRQIFMAGYSIGMRICVFGAGAVGGHIAARLAAAGNDVSVIARGAHLAAMREKGITLLHGDQRITGSVRAAEDPVSLGAHELVIVTLKANALAGIAKELKSMLKGETPVVFAQNGIPWWYGTGLAAGRPRPPHPPRPPPRGALRPAPPAGRV